VEIELPNGWNPRPYQLDGWRAWEAGIKRHLWIWHRRAGKDDVALNLAAVAAHQRTANYWHCLPLYEQARKAIWEAINPHTGRRRIDEAFPPAIRKRTDNSAMTIEFQCGSIWRVVGSDNPDSLVGAPPAGIVFSEWALANPAAWAYLAPILAENDGWAVFITTPRGRNHVKSMLDMARKSPQWFSQVLTPKETGFPLALIEEQRREYHAIFGVDAGDALIDQEYWCSFEAAIIGAYFGREMVEAEREGRICAVPVDPEQPVHTAWDLGVGDSTAIWFFQVLAGGLNVVDYYAATGYGADHYVGVLNERGYAYGHDFVPHDARVREWGSNGRTRIETLKGLKRKPRLVVNVPLDDGINAARLTIPRCRFDAERCESGLEALRQYRKAWDDDKKCFSDKPLHDWTSHGADAYRYLALAWRELRAETPKQPKPIKGVREMTFNEILKRQSPQRTRV